jgi:ATP/maltotriose-dependent transcriptional regulator MalT
MFTELGDQFGMGWSRGLLAWVRYNEGNFEEAESLAELAIGARDSDKWAHGMMLVLLANLRLWRGRAKAALPLANEARALFQSIGDHYGRAMALAAASRSLAAVGDVAEVEKALEEVMSATKRSHRADGSCHLGRRVRASRRRRSRWRCCSTPRPT